MSKGCPRFAPFEEGSSRHSYLRPRPYGASFLPLLPLPPPPLSPQPPLPPPRPLLPAPPLGFPALDLPQKVQWVSLHGELGLHIQRVILVTPQSIWWSISVCLRCFKCLEHGTEREGGGLGPAFLSTSPHKARIFRCKLRFSSLSGSSISDWCRSWVMGSDSPSAASTSGLSDPSILSERSSSTLNAFFVAKDGWVQGQGLSPGTLVRSKDPTRLLIPPALALAQRLRQFSLSGVVQGLLLGERAGESKIRDVDGAV